MEVPTQQINVKKRQDKEKFCADGDFDRQWTEHPPCKCFRCRSIDHIVAKLPKPPKDDDKRWNNARFNERGNHALQKESDDGDDDNDEKIYEYMVPMSGNENFVVGILVIVFNWPTGFDI